ncbi:MAG: hypothetical protein ABI785_05220, partial [Gemmatimonadales bacterium]
MTSRRLLGRRPSTPVRSPLSSRPGHSLPSDLMFQTCRRVGIVGIVFASIWAFMTIMNNFVIRLITDRMDALYPYPGNIVGAAGVASSLLMVGLARKLGDIAGGALIAATLVLAG